jgi:hypothetical protein
MIVAPVLFPRSWEFKRLKKKIKNNLMPIGILSSAGNRKTGK